MTLTLGAPLENEHGVPRSIRRVPAEQPVYGQGEHARQRGGRDGDRLRQPFDVRQKAVLERRGIDSGDRPHL